MFNLDLLSVSKDQLEFSHLRWASYKKIFGQNDSRLPTALVTIALDLAVRRHYAKDDFG